MPLWESLLGVDIAAAVWVSAGLGLAKYWFHRRVTAGLAPGREAGELNLWVDWDSTALSIPVFRVALKFENPTGLDKSGELSVTWPVPQLSSFSQPILLPLEFRNLLEYEASHRKGTVRIEVKAVGLRFPEYSLSLAEARRIYEGQGKAPKSVSVLSVVHPDTPAVAQLHIEPWLLAQSKLETLTQTSLDLVPSTQELKSENEVTVLVLTPQEEGGALEMLSEPADEVQVVFEIHPVDEQGGDLFESAETSLLLGTEIHSPVALAESPSTPATEAVVETGAEVTPSPLPGETGVPEVIVSAVEWIPVTPTETLPVIEAGEPVSPLLETQAPLEEVSVILAVELSPPVPDSSAELLSPPVPLEPPTEIAPLRVDAPMGTPEVEPEPAKTRSKKKAPPKKATGEKSARSRKKEERGDIPAVVEEVADLAPEVPEEPLMPPPVPAPPASEPLSAGAPVPSIRDLIAKRNAAARAKADSKGTRPVS